MYDTFYFSGMKTFSQTKINQNHCMTFLYVCKKMVNSTEIIWAINTMTVSRLQPLEFFSVQIKCYKRTGATFSSVAKIMITYTNLHPQLHFLPNSFCEVSKYVSHIFAIIQCFVLLLLFMYYFILFHFFFWKALFRNQL